MAFAAFSGASAVLRGVIKLRERLCGCKAHLMSNASDADKRPPVPEIVLLSLQPRMGAASAHV